MGWPIPKSASAVWLATWASGRTGRAGLIAGAGGGVVGVFAQGMSADRHRKFRFFFRVPERLFM
jgi:hypothetical protein